MSELSIGRRVVSQWRDDRAGLAKTMAVELGGALEAWQGVGSRDLILSDYSGFGGCLLLASQPGSALSIAQREDTTLFEIVPETKASRFLIGKDYVQQEGSMLRVGSGVP
jgi:hypothetical protein